MHINLLATAALLTPALAHVAKRQTTPPTPPQILFCDTGYGGPGADGTCDQKPGFYTFCCKEIIDAKIENVYVHQKGDRNPSLQGGIATSCGIYDGLGTIYCAQ